MIKRTLLLVSLVALNTQPSLAQGSPGRCSNSGQFKVYVANLSEELLPYARCLVAAEQSYGYNGGPFAVSQCGDMRRSITQALSASDADHGVQLMDEIENGFVWQVWCSTDVGRELPADISIKAGWPQASRNTNASN